MGLKAFTRSPQRPTNPAYKKVFKYKLSYCTLGLLYVYENYNQKTIIRLIK